MFTTDNFHSYTFANYRRVESAPARPADFVSDSGSEYWYEGGRVVRRSNHWGANISTAHWMLDGTTSREVAVGVADLSDFHPVAQGKGLPTDGAYVFHLVNVRGELVTISAEVQGGSLCVNGEPFYAYKQVLTWI